MKPVDWISVGFGVLGVAYGIRCYWELYKWARQCQNARIAISFKRKVRLQAPLVEWLLWANNVKKDKLATGQVVFSQANVSVAVVQADTPPGKVRKAIRTARGRHGQTAPQQGRWSARDETPADRKNVSV